MSRPRILGVGGVVAAMALFSAALSPAVASAQEESTGSEAGSVDAAIGMLPEEIVVGPSFGGGSEALRDLGSGVVPDTAQSVGEVAGSVAPLEAVGSTGGSAAASVASSGSLPGSTYVNPTGSLGSGTFGFGPFRVPEIALPVLALELSAGVVAGLGERQAAGELTDDELTFWHGVVVGSAEGGGTLEDAADATGVELPAALTGSIENVREAADSDPFEEQERLRAELEAEAAAEESEEDAESEGVESEGGAGDGEARATDGDAAASEAEAGATDDEAGAGDDEAAASDESPRGEGAGDDATVATDSTPVDDDEVTTGRVDTVATDAIPAGEAAPVAQAGAGAPVEAISTPAAPRLAETGVGTTALIGVALTALAAGALLLGASRRRA